MLKAQLGGIPEHFILICFLWAGSISSLKTDGESRRRLGNGLWTEVSIKFCINSFPFIQHSGFQP